MTDFEKLEQRMEEIPAECKVVNNEAAKKIQDKAVKNVKKN